MIIYLNEGRLYSKKAEDILGKIGKISSEKLSRNKINIIFVKLRDKIDKNFLQRFANLKYIVCPTTSITHIDQQYCRKNKIKIIKLDSSDTKLKNVTSTAELTMGLILSLKRNIHKAYLDSLKSKLKSRYDYTGQSLNNLTIGIIGIGRIGKMVARMSNAFNMKVIAYDMYKKSIIPKFVTYTNDITKIFELSDIISIHISHIKKNYNFINKDLIYKSKKKPLLINTSRGEFLDEKALLSALKDGVLSGAGVDVISDKSRVHKFLENNKSINLLITPHIGGCTLDEMKLTEQIVCKKLFREVKKNEF